MGAKLISSFPYSLASSLSPSSLGEPASVSLVSHSLPSPKSSDPLA